MRYLLPILLVASACGPSVESTETAEPCETDFTECNRVHDPEHTLCPLKLAYWCTCDVEIPAHCEAADEHLVCCLPKI